MLVFVPLGGVGEIGMNLYLYGYGRRGAYEWLVVDMGVTFGSEYEPGIDIIMPDIRFIEEECHNIAGNVEYLLRVEVGDLTEYKDFHAHTLGQLPQVSSITSHFCLETSKDLRNRL